MVFNDLYKENHDKDVEKNYQGLKYLSWATAYKIAKEKDENFHFEICTNENKMPYFYDDTLQVCFVKTKCYFLNDKKEMFLPVLDNKHKPVKKDVLNSFLINNAIMRCLTKNISLFGIGLYLYTGEDISMYKDNKKENEKDNDFLYRFKESLISALSKNGSLKDHNIDSLNQMSMKAFNKIPEIWDNNTINNVLLKINKLLEE